MMKTKLVLVLCVMAYPANLVIAQATDENVLETCQDEELPGVDRFAACQKAAEQGHAEAQYNLGRMYDIGEGVKENDADAVKWYRRAAEQGHAKAQFAFGYMCDLGYGISKNVVVATEWYRRAAEQGHARAQFNLGNLYTGGYGITEDVAKAAEWYRRAAEQGHARAQFTLGALYARGEGVPKNKLEALKWYRMAARQGNLFAQWALEDLNVKNINREDDNDHDSMNKNANGGSEGRGLPRIGQEAFQRYRMAAEQGDASAQFNLGNLYYKGEGMPKNDEEAGQMVQTRC